MSVQDWNDEEFLKSIGSQPPEITEKESLIEPESKAETAELEDLSEEDVLAINNVDEKVSTKSKASTASNNETEIDKDSFYKARIEYAKTIGRLPEDFELEDDVVLDDESYSKVMDYENQYVYEAIVSQVREEYIKKLGNNVINFVENGGDVTKIAELIKEENKIAELNTSIESGQKAIITQYYEELEWSDTKIKKHIDRLLNDDELEEESIELKAKLEKTVGKKQEQLVRKQEEIFQKKEALEKKQINDFASVLEDRGMSKKAIGEYIDYAFKDEEISGVVMPKLDFKILQIQRKPEELLELIEFVNNKTEYLKRKSIEINNPKVDKTFESILKNKAKIKGSGSNPLQSPAGMKPNFKF